MGSLKISHTVTERFLRYVKIDTQSEFDSPNFPSTEKQKDLGRVLVKELLEIGVSDAHMDANGYVYGTIPSTSARQVPVIFFCAHMDTSPECSGKDVKPIVHPKWDGKDIVLPGDSSQVIRMSEHPALREQVGNDVITSDGTTLLGADNKSGVAEIMDAACFLVKNPQIPHGTVKIVFTPDEEVAHGVDKLDVKKLNAQFGYTMDGESLGNIEDETFSADMAIIEIEGFTTHPGYAKGKMENAVKIASEIINNLPKDRLSPETTENKQGFIHPVSMNGGIDKIVIKFLIRDYTKEGLASHESFLKSITENVLKPYRNSSFKFSVQEQYRNMKEVLNHYPDVVAYALEAIRRTGIEPKLKNIRGGTDGARLSFMGLPCPNIFAGEHAFHSKLEWVSVQDMEKAVETIVHLCMIWEEKSSRSKV